MSDRNSSLAQAAANAAAAATATAASSTTPEEPSLAQVASDASARVARKRAAPDDTDSATGNDVGGGDGRQVRAKVDASSSSSRSPPAAAVLGASEQLRQQLVRLYREGGEQNGTTVVALMEREVKAGRTVELAQAHAKAMHELRPSVDDDDSDDDGLVVARAPAMAMAMASSSSAAPSAASTGVTVQLPFDPNFATVTTFPAHKEVRPVNGEELVSAMQAAREEGRSIRAIGMGLSFSDVGHCEPGAVLLRTDGLVATDLPGPSQVVPDVAPHVHVEAGINVRSLNSYLTGRQQALLNQGAYDGQTLVGALSTGTHGTSTLAPGKPPMADGVMSLVLMRFDRNGAVEAVRVEDPASRWCSVPNGQATGETVGSVRVKAVVDADLFSACLVSCGALGIIYSVVLQVREHYNLHQHRIKLQWSSMVTQLDGWLNDPSIASVDVLVSPYLDAELGWSTAYNRDKLKCVVTLRRETTKPPSGARTDGVSRVLREVLGDIISADVPAVVVPAVNIALGRVASQKDWIGACTEVLNLGEANFFNARSFEFGVDAAHWRPVAERLLAKLHSLARLGIDNLFKRHEVVSSPFAMRFTSASRAMMAMESGRKTCMIEVPSVGTNRSLERELRKGVYKELLKWLTTDPQMVNEFKARLHWGQLHGRFLTREYVRKVYDGAAVQRFSELVHEANDGHDSFVNAFVKTVFL